MGWRQETGASIRLPFLPHPTTPPPQVFHVPLEERRYQVDDASVSADSRQADIVRDVMAQTSCDVEMSQTKDRGLTIMVSGKPMAVAQARREILRKLQTQVRGGGGEGVRGGANKATAVHLSLTGACGAQGAKGAPQVHHRSRQGPAEED